MRKELPVLRIVVPCYNEEKCLPETHTQFENTLLNLMDLHMISPDSYILYVNDGSTDGTWNYIQYYARTKTDGHYLSEGISFYHNEGHMTALYAGLMDNSRPSDITVTADADCQDDLRVIFFMVMKWSDGKDVVYGVRSNRDSDSFFKKTTAEIYYKLEKSLNPDTIENHADFRLMDQSVIEELRKYHEHDLYLRGIIPHIVPKEKTAVVMYERKPRTAGETHYPLKKMLDLARTGFVSVSTELLKKLTMSAIIFHVLSVLFLLFALIFDLLKQTCYSTLTTASVIIWCTSLILLACAIVGEYIARITTEVLNRPKYTITQTTFEKSEADTIIKTSGELLPLTEVEASCFKDQC